MWENKEILNLKTERRKNLFSIRTKLSHYQVFHRNFTANNNEKDKDTSK